MGQTIQIKAQRCCSYTGLPLPAHSGRARQHPEFARTTRGWNKQRKQRYAALVRELGTLHHPRLRQLKSAIWQEIHDERAAAADKKAGQQLDQVLARNADDEHREQR